MSKHHHREDFGFLFRELLDTRNRYENLRGKGGHYAERAELLDRLHGLRHEMAITRNVM